MVSEALALPKLCWEEAVQCLLHTSIATRSHCVAPLPRELSGDLEHWNCSAGISVTNHFLEESELLLGDKVSLSLQ